MPISISTKLQAIVDEIDTQGYARLTRLTVLKKWFEHPGRLSAFGLWMAKHAAGSKVRTKAAAGALLKEAQALLRATGTREVSGRPVDLRAARRLHGRAREFHNEFKRHQWGAVRIIHCWPLLLVEKGLSLYLGEASSAEGYKLAADFCQHFDSRYGSCLSGPSRAKLMEIICFISDYEAVEKKPADKASPAARRTKPCRG